MRRPLRVLHVPSAVGGNPQGLARAERQIGLDSTCIVLEASPFAYEGADLVVPPTAGRSRRIRARIRALEQALRHADVVHFNFGRTLLPPPGPRESAVLELVTRTLALRDLPLLRRAGKVIAVTFQGDDARQHRSLVARMQDELLASVPDDYYTEAGDEAKRQTIDAFDRHAHLIYYLNPDLATVLPERARFMPYAHVDLVATPAAPRLTHVGLRVVHAPSHRGVKGTASVIGAIETLRARGIDVHLDLVEGLPHRQAMARYAEADVGIDQLLIGWYGGFGVELMALGRPVIAHLREDDLTAIPTAMRCELPVIEATCDTLVDVLQRLAHDRDLMLQKGRESRRFVERWHDPLQIVRGLLRDYLAAATSASRRILA